MSNRLPDFIIIGAAKAGTSSLYAYLNEHPEIFMSPIKETNYFAYDGRLTKNFLGKRAKTHFPIKSMEAYRALFIKADEQQVLGEASPLYLESPVAANRIRKVLPDVGIIAILRNPADRAFSGYATAVRHGIQKPIDIYEALEYSSHYVQVGFYHRKLSRYFELFDPARIKIYLLDDFKENGLSVVHDIFEFLGVNTSFSPNVQVKYNVGSSFPKWFLVSKLLRYFRKYTHRPTIRQLIPKSIINMGDRVQNKNIGSNIEFPISLRNHLMKIYHDDIMKLQDLIKRDLSAWTKVQ